MGCMSVLALHRAFEKMFERISTGITVWMQTFSREQQHLDIRLATYAYPCRRVFYKLADADKGMCKNELFKTGEGEEQHEIEEEHPCEKEKELNFGVGEEGIGEELWESEGGEASEEGHEEEAAGQESEDEHEEKDSGDEDVEAKGNKEEWAAWKRAYLFQEESKEGSSTGTSA